MDTALASVLSPLRKKAPLWSVILVGGLQEDRSALLVVLHHVLADGIGGLSVLASLVDPGSGAIATAFPEAPPAVVALLRDALVGKATAVVGVAGSWRLLRSSMGAGGGLHPPRITRCSLVQPDRPEPAHPGGALQVRRPARRRASVRGDDQRRRPGRRRWCASAGAGRAGRERRSPRHHRAGLGTASSTGPGARQPGQPAARPCSHPRARGPTAGSGRGRGPRRQGGRNGPAAHRRARLAVPAVGQAGRVPLVPEPPAPLPHAGEPPAWTGRGPVLRGPADRRRRTDRRRRERELDGLLRGPDLQRDTDHHRDRRPRPLPRRRGAEGRRSRASCGR